MGLRTKEAEVTLDGKNITYYESKGYLMPRRKDDHYRISVPRNSKLLVKVVDLPDKSSCFVDVECDGCHISKSMRWIVYKKGVKDNSTYYCKHCSNKLSSRNEKVLNTKLSRTISFEQWCIKNNRQDILIRWDYDSNNCKPNKICYSTNKKYYFKCPKKIHKSELKLINSFVNGSEGSMDCNQCNSFAQWGIDNLGDDFLEKYWDYDKNIIDPWELSYGSKTKVFIKCQEKTYHGSYPIKCNDFVNDCRCLYCSPKNSSNIHVLDSLGTLYPEVLNLWSNKNKKSPYEYAPSNNEVYWKCSEGKHKDFKRKITESIHYNFRCSECSRERDESFLQEKVRLYLESLNYTVLHEYKCSIIPQNPKIKNKLGRMPFDNEIVELKLILEVHGVQHYKLNTWYYKKAKKNNTTPEYELHRQKLHDRYKRIFAKSRGYFYLEIPYWTDDENETWKELINNKILSLSEVVNIA